MIWYKVIWEESKSPNFLHTSGVWSFGQLSPNTFRQNQTIDIDEDEHQ